MRERIELDAVVIGGGVVGLAVARALSIAGRDVTLLESEAATGSITSSRNSEVVHAGIYYPSGSLKAILCVEGKASLYAYCEARGIPHLRCGKLVVAASPAEAAYLERLQAQARENGVDDCTLIDAGGLKRLEPELEGAAALMSPSTGIVDSHRLMECCKADIERAGGTVVTNAPVLGGALEGDRIRLFVGGRDPVDVEARLAVNCAGLDAWAVSRRIAGLDAKTIPQRHLAKGSYFALSGPSPARRLVYPVPEPGGLGTHLTLDLAGQARFGPDVEWIDSIGYDVDPRRAGDFYAAIRRYWPGLPDGALQPAYAGIRPKVTGPGEAPGDFVIQGPSATGHPALAALYGIESPGLTASLAIGRHVAQLCAAFC